MNKQVLRIMLFELNMSKAVKLDNLFTCFKLRTKLPAVSRRLSHDKASNQAEIATQHLRTYGQPAPSTHPHLIKEGEATSGINVSEFADRRHRLMDLIGYFSRKRNREFKNHLVVIPSATKVYMSEKIPYVFRQNTDFLYLSGCLEPDSLLVLNTVPEQSVPHHVSTLFVQNRDPHSELWDGPRSGVDGAVELLGVDCALPVDEFERYLECFCRDSKSFLLWYNYIQPPHAKFHETMKEFMFHCWHKGLESPQELVQQLRLFKSPAEVELLKKSCAIASESMICTIKSSHPNVTEHQLFARMDYECRMRGAEYLAYPPVVAGGKRANIIHYINNNNVVFDGEMVLMDAGCEYHGYCSDLTRTWPVSGHYEKGQKELYQVVLEVQQALIQACHYRPTLDSLFQTMCQLLGEKLQQLNILPQSYSSTQLETAAYKFCPHHVSHYIGMDLHDTALIRRNIAIAPGMVITMEPGVYIPEDRLEVPKEYRGLGVRIEDDILIAEEGPIILTSSCPKQVADIENLLSQVS